jgi:hypothetical protein
LWKSLPPLHHEDRRSRRDELTEKLVYLAIHKAPKKWTMRIRKRTESHYHWRFPERHRDPGSSPPLAASCVFAEHSVFVGRVARYD